MASIYARGDVLWMKFKNQRGKPECRSTGYRKGQEAVARELAAEVERQAANEREAAAASVAAPAAMLPTPERDETIAERIGSPAAAGMLTVRAYGEAWIKRRDEVASVKDESTRLKLHVYPLIGHMAIAEVRPRHIRDLVNALKQKTSESRKCKGEKLAPRTVRHIYGLLRRMFKSAVIDEHIAASPVVVEKNTLPKNIDKDPAWRSTAIFERDELVMLISDERISLHRRIMNALEGLAGVRHGEAAGLRWRDYDPGCKPLGKLVVCRSYERDGTKTQMTREVPVHPTLATLLDAWKSDGWARTYKRSPKPEDLIVPTANFTARSAANTLKQFKKELELLGLRDRRGHDLRRTFITLAQVDGARRDVLKPLTHPGEADIVGLYTTFPWPTICAEVAKLRVVLPGDGGERGGSDDSATDAGEGAAGPLGVAAGPAETGPAGTPEAPQAASEEIAPDFREPTVATVAGYAPGYTPVCSQETSMIRSRWPDLNRRPTVYETVALPTELHRLGLISATCQPRPRQHPSRVQSVCSQARSGGGRGLCPRAP